MPQNSSTIVIDEEKKLPIDIQEELIFFLINLHIVSKNTNCCKMYLGYICCLAVFSKKVPTSRGMVQL